MVIKSFSCMDKKFDAFLEEYTYALPKELVRSSPLSVRHDAKLFVYDTKNEVITHTTFKELARFLPRETLLVLNDTKVLPVRFHGINANGAKREVFLLVNEEKIEGKFQALIRGSCRPGDNFYLTDTVYFTLEEKIDDKVLVTLHGASLEEALRLYGKVPLPHYIESDIPESEARERYQTVFAEDRSLLSEKGSVAAPTASLHFTEEVFASLADNGVKEARVTLHVGRGTFAPLTEEAFTEKRLHSEWYSIDKESVEKIERAKKDKAHICAVGTTAMRTLESFGKSDESTGETTIFITPPHPFVFADVMITNFHLPKTSLMMLVQAFLEYKGAKKHVKELYEIAIEENYAFYSFGDSMLIL